MPYRPDGGSLRVELVRPLFREREQKRGGLLARLIGLMKRPVKRAA